MTRFEPALCTVTFRALPPEEIVPLAREAGLKAIEWAGDAHVPPGDAARADAAGRLSREAGLALSYGSYVAPPTDGLEAFARVLETAAQLGAGNIRVWPGSRGRASADYSADEARSVAVLIREMGGMAEPHGITVSLEYHPGSLTDDTDSALRLIDQVGRDNVYLYWQPRPGLPLADALAEIARVGPHVSHLHVFAWDAARNRFPLARAVDYWRDVIEAMPPSRWRGRRFAMLEFVAADASAAFRADAATLARILAQAGS